MTQLAADVSRKARQKACVKIVGIGTATPPAAPQEEALRFAMTLSGLAEDQHAWLKRIYRQSGIESRGSVLLREGEDHYESAREFYPPSKGPGDRGPGTAARMAVYAREAPKLACRSAGAALENSKIRAGEITHLITASCTGFYAPGLDRALIEGLGLDRGVRRVHVGFMGCHAAFNALSAARDIAAAHAEARVLVCCVELCSLQWAYGADPGKLVANALFADGSASAVVAAGGHGSEGGGGGGWEIEDFSSYLIPESADAMTWNLGDHGFEMTLSPGVPEIIRKNMGVWCDSWLAREELSRADISGWAIHPGGPKILEAARDGLELGAEDLRFSRGVLSRHGNMSSATVLFILNQMAREITGRVVAIGLGPGLIAEGMRVRR
jgi:prepilin-type processing-associated H-X9-DG protein